MPELEYFMGDRLPIQRATTLHLRALNPLWGESGIIDKRTGKKVPGLPIGKAGRNGSAGSFSFDPYMFHAARGLDGAPIIHNLNVIILGLIDMGKSALVKQLVYLACAAGYSCLVTDIKGEYGPLVRAIPGAKELKFGDSEEDEKLSINPLDKNIPDEIQRELIASLALATMGEGRSELNIEEKGVLWAAIRDAKRHYGVGADGLASDIPVLAAVVDKLFDPTPEMAKEHHESQEFLRQTGRAMALGLKQLTEGDLVGIVDKPTSHGFWADTPLLVLNCKDLSDDKLPIMVIAANYLTSSQFGKSNSWGRFQWVWHDETWRLAGIPGFVSSLRASFKLGRSEGVFNGIVFHHLENLWRSSQQAIVKDLIGDADTRIIYQQNRFELGLSSEALQLSEEEQARIPNLPAHTALWKIGKRSIEVEHVLVPELEQVIQTGHLAKGEVVKPSYAKPAS